MQVLNEYPKILHKENGETVFVNDEFGEQMMRHDGFMTGAELVAKQNAPVKPAAKGK